MCDSVSVIIELRCHIIAIIRACSFQSGDITDGLGEAKRPALFLPRSMSAGAKQNHLPLTSDVQAVPAPDLALAVQHDVAPFVRHPDRVQRHLLVRHADVPRVLGRHRRLVVEHRQRRLRRLLDDGLVGANDVRPAARE